MSRWRCGIREIARLSEQPRKKTSAAGWRNSVESSTALCRTVWRFDSKKRLCFCLTDSVRCVATKVLSKCHTAKQKFLVSSLVCREQICETNVHCFWMVRRRKERVAAALGSTFSASSTWECLLRLGVWLELAGRWFVSFKACQNVHKTWLHLTS